MLKPVLFKMHNGLKYILVYLLTCINVYSQHSSNIWYFGNKAGLDFNSGVPVALTDGQMYVDEGCSTIADENGLLLFYTNGINVWNKNHQVMPNGSDLLGNNSSSQSSVVIPKPGSSTIYYIFTTPELGNSDGARYSEVDISLNNGLGDITTNKNILLFTPACEKIAAIKKANGTDYWVVFHGYENNTFLAYSVTSSGIDTTPVTTSIGPAGDVYRYTVGYLKFSPDGSKLACCNYSYNVELFNFDTATGTVSNYTVLSSHYASYGAEFSPSGNLLYISTGSVNILDLLQYDLTAADVAASETLLYSSPGVEHQVGAPQLAIDGKIYVPIFDEHYLAVINNPEVAGAGCSFVLNGVPLGTGIGKSGLPQFIQSNFDITIASIGTCLGDTTAFSLTGNQNISSALWDFGDGTSSTEINPGHTFALPGTYMVSVSAQGINGAVTETRQITISGVPVANPVSNQFLCANTNQIDLSQFNTTLLGSQDAGVFSVAYFPSLADAQQHSNALPLNYSLPTGSTVIYAKVYNTNNINCNDIKQFTIDLSLQPVINTVTDYVICEPQPYDNTEVFNLSLKTPEILGGQDSSMFSVAYYLSQSDADSNQNALPLSYTNITNNQGIFVRIQNVANTGCYATTHFFLRVIQQPTIVSVPDFMVCDDASGDGIAQYNLVAMDTVILSGLPVGVFEVHYYPTVEDANNAINEIVTTYTSLYNGQEVFFVVNPIGNGQCSVLSSFKLKTSAIPVLTPIDDVHVCDDASNDGIQSIDLSTLVNDVLNGLSALDYLVSFHISQSDADSNSQPLPMGNINISNSQIVYVRVQNTANNSCYDTMSLKILVDYFPVAIQVPDIVECSDIVGQFHSYINLLPYKGIAMGSLNPDSFSASFFYSLYDAQTDSSPLPDIYEYIQESGTLYVKVKNINHPDCFDIKSVNVLLRNKPDIDFPESFVICEDGAITLTAPIGLDGYLWSGGQTTQSINVYQPGQYTLSIVKDYGDILCDNTFQFTVNESLKPRISKIYISDWTENSNSFQVETVGLWIDYEYSIDGMDYQDSPLFENLSPGQYVVHVKDKLGCGEVLKKVYLLNYPKFFTPNGDGHNDEWLIPYSRYENTFNIFIYDRFGKLITSFNGKNGGWDGTLNGHALPSTDYWFLIEREGGIFKGHFSLIR